jgi:flagellar basal-body rod protein FlgB
MDFDSIFDKTIDLAQKSLDLRSRRHEVLLSNIANADTPGYKAFDLMVEEALSKEAPKGDQVRLKCTDEGHLPCGGNGDASSIQPQRVALNGQVTLRGDGNTVDMDREMTSLSENQLQFRMASQILAKKFASLHNIIKGGQQ